MLQEGKQKCHRKIKKTVTGPLQEDEKALQEDKQ